MSPVIMASGREVRRVPLNYQHPTCREQRQRFGTHAYPSVGDDPASLNFRPYDEAIREWWAEREEWTAGGRPNYFTERDGDPWTFEEYTSGPPSPAYYLRHPLPPESPENPYGIQLWETVSEGSPISPVFPDSEDGRRAMAEYMAKHDTDSILSHLAADEWLQIIDGSALGTNVHTGELV